MHPAGGGAVLHTCSLSLVLLPVQAHTSAVHLLSLHRQLNTRMYMQHDYKHRDYRIFSRRQRYVTLGMLPSSLNKINPEITCNAGARSDEYVD
jgi:hypothetical protein